MRPRRDVCMRRNALLYILMVLGFGLGIYFMLQAGRRLETASFSPPSTTSETAPVAGPASPSATTSDTGGITRALEGLRGNLHDPLSLLLVQLILIVLLARVFGMLFAKMGQPAVIGEMLAGIVLGPSVVGTLFPGAFQFIFPAASLGALRMLSQVGVILFMFVVGMELDLAHLRGKAHTAIVVSHVSIIFPCFLGVLFS